MNALTIFNQAKKAGQEAYEKKLSEIEAGPDRFLIQEADIFGKALPNSQSWGMKELCGFAWVHFCTKRGSKALEFVNELKKCGIAGNFNDGIRRKEIEIRPDYPSGWCFWVPVMTQGINSKEAYANAFAEILKKNGIECYSQTRLD